MESSLLRRMRGEFRRAASAAAAGYADFGRPGSETALQEHEDRVMAALEPHWRRTFAVFGDRMIGAAKASHRRLETKDVQSEFTARVRRWIDTYGAAKVKAISETTRQNIARAIDDGVAEGEGVPAIAKRIRDTGRGAIGASRSLVIARTETHSASTAAQDEALAVLDLPSVKREWVAAEDERTRETHRAASGQIRGQGQPFSVGGVALMYPGDPSGPPREIIGCRCIAAAVIED